VKNKYVQALVLLFKMEWPEMWPTFFNELCDLLQVGPVMVDMFLRICDNIARLVLSADAIRSTGDLARANDIVFFHIYCFVL
jgi:exportin-T